ncbi:DNA mismatch repair protein MutS [Flavobacteriales bacterium]|nr:DNA mismatch repair protein MutS [Flavobacteriales bacterium]
MAQYNQIKRKHPDALLLFRVGDFYETFGKDAIKASKILGIVLTARNNGGSKIELAGFPHHSMDTYLPKLVRAGHRVAICDQLEDPKLTKKIVKRGVTELVTPGVSFNDQVLEQKSNNFLAAIHFDGTGGGVSFLDVSTGEFLLAEGSLEYIDKLMQGFQPKEVLYEKHKDQLFTTHFGNRHYSYRLDDWVFKEDYARESLQQQFGTNSLKGFGVADLSKGIVASGAILQYLSQTEHKRLDHITNLSRIEEEKYVWLDRFTVRNLELLYSPNQDAKTLIEVLDETISPMGGRLLKRWLLLPLKDKKAIEERLSVVESFLNNSDERTQLCEEIAQIGDLERLISKVAAGRVNPREVNQLRRALTAIEPIAQCCKNTKIAAVKQLGSQLNLCASIKNKIAKELNDDAPVLLSKGGVISDGVSQELDDLRAIAYSGKDYLVQIQQREMQATGISSLKIAYNNVFGYYLEVRNTYKDKVPDSWIRKQTLTQAERYITEELKEYESKILGAEEKINVLEAQLFQELVEELAQFIPPVQQNAAIVAHLDCLLSFATISEKYGYVKPKINEGLELVIHAGRHPVIEKQLPLGEPYIANDTFLDSKNQQIVMITGPNMSGKSAILRQTALIVLIAQMGCFVPAKAAEIGLVDKIFTRVGASDNISSGESTFMVEMNETASILNNLSERSLILLDEIGRGTSTYDGISIAWSITEYLHEHKCRPKTLFATHYHELNEMSTTFARIKNFNVAVKEAGEKVHFLRKLVPGGSNHSFGIHVAQMAGMPRRVISRAKDVLQQLEQTKTNEQLSAKAKEVANDAAMQLSFFQLDDPVLEQIRDEITQIDINSLTPVEALMKLNEIKNLTGG